MCSIVSFTVGETLPEPPSFLRDLSYDEDEPDGRYQRAFTEPRNRPKQVQQLITVLHIIVLYITVLHITAVYITVHYFTTIHITFVHITVLHITVLHITVFHHS